MKLISKVEKGQLKETLKKTEKQRNTPPPPPPPQKGTRMTDLKAEALEK